MVFFNRNFKALNPHTPVVQKVADEVIFRCFPGEESSFKSDLTDSPQICETHLLENTNLCPSSLHLSVFFISRSCFESDGFIAYSNE